MKGVSLPRQVLRVALITGALLVVPAVAMLFTSQVSWGPGDFVIAAALLFATGCAIVVARRIKHRGRRVGVIVLAVFALLLVWAELAVGLFH
jgi:peptidoglycan/LPS O-acetylase OafA/YrhL